MKSWLRVSLLLAAAVALVILACYSHGRLRGLGRYTVDMRVLELRMQDTWVDERLAESLAESFPDMGVRSIYDADLLRDAARALEADPWVRQVVAVERSYPSRLAVSFEIRQPEAIVRQSGKLYLVDRDGVRLPGEFDSPPETRPEAARPLPVFSGIEVDVPPPGSRWNAPGISIGFAMVDLLEARGVQARVAIHEIDVSYDERANDRTVTLVAGVNRTRVLWGKSPLNPDPADADDDRKIANLEGLLRRSPGLAGLSEASIAGDFASLTPHAGGRGPGAGGR